jgi:hypothetical protein
MNVLKLPVAAAHKILCAIFQYFAFFLSIDDDARVF